MNVLKNLLLKAVLCAGILIGGTHSAKAQLDLAGEILRAGTDDANLLFKEYIRPFAEGFGADLNTGWISRSRPNSVLQLDIMLRTGVAFVPSSSRTFSIEEIPRSEEHTSELQSRGHLVCRLLLEKKKTTHA